MLFPLRDIGAHVKCFIAGASTASSAPSLITAGGTGDATKVTGQTINRQGSSGSLADSMVLSIGWQAALTNAKSLSFAVEYQTSSDGSNWDSAVAVDAGSVAKLAGSSATFFGVVEYNLDISGLKQYIRFNITPDLSNTGTDTAEYAAVAVLGGYKISKDAV